MTCQNLDYTNAVLYAYQSILTNAEFFDKIAQQTGLEAQSDITHTIGIHTVSEVNKSTASRVDPELAELQKAKADRVFQLNDSLETKQKELDELGEPERPADPSVSAIRGGLRYALLGGKFGAGPFGLSELSDEQQAVFGQRGAEPL